MTKINGFQRASVQTDRRNEIARSILVKEQLGLGLGLDDRKNLTLPNWLPSGIYRIMKWKGTVEPSARHEPFDGELAAALVAWLVC